MCQSQNSFWACRCLAQGRFLMCERYRSTAGRECDGYTSFSRVVRRPCPRHSRQEGRTSPNASEARDNSDQATAGAEERKNDSGTLRPIRPKQPYAPNRPSALSRCSMAEKSTEDGEQQAAGGAEGPARLVPPTACTPATSVSTRKIPALTTRADLDAMTTNTDFDNLFETDQIPVDPALLKQ